MSTTRSETLPSLGPSPSHTSYLQCAVYSEEFLYQNLDFNFLLQLFLDYIVYGLCLEAE